MRQVGINDGLRFTAHAAASSYEFQKVDPSAFFNFAYHRAGSPAGKAVGCVQRLSDHCADNALRYCDPSLAWSAMSSKSIAASSSSP